VIYYDKARLSKRIILFHAKQIQQNNDEINQPTLFSKSFIPKVKFEVRPNSCQRFKLTSSTAS
jgi:hypothetical protein